jgi:hypothetical protein
VRYKEGGAKPSSQVAAREDDMNDSTLSLDRYEAI